MEHTGTLPQGPVDVSDLDDLVMRPGPVATVYLGTPAAVENAAQHDQVRWNDVRRDLRAAGAPDGALDAVEAVIPDAHLEGDGLAVFADESGLLHVEHAPSQPRAETARWDTLPSLAPLIEWRQHQPPYLVALVDHRGADLFAGGRGVGERREEVEGSGRDPIARNAPGGWSQRHYQQHAIENWAQNAKEVAVEVDRLAATVDPAVVLVGGDARSVELLVEALSDGPLAERIERIDGTRAADGSDAETAHEVARMVATVAARDSVSVLREFRQQLGREDRAVEGVESTMEALRRAQVAVLLVHDDAADDRRGWFGDEANLVAARREDLEGVGGGPSRQGRLVDVAIRAAVGTGAAVRVVPSAGGPADGIGALLRWAD